MATNENSSEFEGSEVNTPEDILRQQATDQESLLILNRALKREQERRAEFLRTQEREFIDARDRRRTQIEQMVLSEADALKREGVPEEQIIPALVTNFFAQISPQESFPDIAAELKDERDGLDLDSELQFFSENASDAFVELDSNERERIVSMEAQFREHNDLPPLSESIKQLWSDPETRANILKYGSYGVMAAVLVGSGGAAAPAMLASKVATRMMPHFASAVDNVSHAVGRTLVRHNVISPETYNAATEKVVALGHMAKTNKYMKAGRFALMGAVAMVAGAAGADAAGLFDGASIGDAQPETSSGTAGNGEPTPEATESSPEPDNEAKNADNPSAGDADTLTPAGAGDSPNAADGNKASTPSHASTEAAPQAEKAGVEPSESESRQSDPNVLDGAGAAADGWGANALDSDGGAGDWASNAFERATGPVSEVMDTQGPSPDTPSEQPQGDQPKGEQFSPASQDVAGAGIDSLSANQLIESMRDANLSTTQVEMFYPGADLSAEDLADIVELSENPVSMMQVLAAQGVDVATLDIEAPDSAEMLSEHGTGDLAMDSATLPPIEVTVEKSDSLSEIIAQQLRNQGIEVTSDVLYGDGNAPGLVDQIANHNPHITNPDLIYPGETVTLPMEMLHGESPGSATLSPESLASVDDVVVSGEDVGASADSNTPQEKAAAKMAASATEVTTPPGGSEAQPTQSSVAEDLISGQFDVHSRVDEHLANHEASMAQETMAQTSTPDTTATEDGQQGGWRHRLDAMVANAKSYFGSAGTGVEQGLGVSDTQPAQSSVTQDLSSGQFDVVENVNEHLAGYEASAGKSEAAAHSATPETNGTNEGQEGTGSWRERLNAMAGQVKSYLVSSAISGEGTHAATPDASVGDAGTADNSNHKSNWQVLTEAAEQAQGESPANQQAGGSPSADPTSTPEAEANDNTAQPVDGTNKSRPIYASYNGTRGPGL